MNPSSSRRLSAWLFAAVVACPGAAWAQAAASAGTSPQAPDGARWSGWLHTDFARVWANPAHTAVLRLRTEWVGTGQWASGLKWKLGARLGVDAAYRPSADYPRAVRDDQYTEHTLREAYIDWNRGEWDWRFGSQHIVWGEMVGLFFADVVSAKDLRQFVLQDFERIRIPQWAIRAERTAGGQHWDLVWLPAPAMDRIGKPGADFYPAPLRYDGLDYDVRSATKPPRRLASGGFGARFSTESAGWDWSTFVYRSPDGTPSFGRELVGLPGERLASGVIYRPTHDRLLRIGATAARAFDDVVVKGEAIYTRGRRFAVPDPGATQDRVRQDTLDWVVGVELTPREGLRANAQLFQRVFLDHDRATGLKRFESGASLMLTQALGPTLDAEWLGIASLVRSDWMMRAAMIWKPTGRLRLRAGADWFGGSAVGLFGRYDRQDRAYVQMQYSY